MHARVRVLVWLRGSARVKFMDRYTLFKCQAFYCTLRQEVYYIYYRIVQKVQKKKRKKRKKSKARLIQIS